MTCSRRFILSINLLFDLWAVNVWLKDLMVKDFVRLTTQQRDGKGKSNQPFLVLVFLFWWLVVSAICHIIFMTFFELPYLWTKRLLERKDCWLMIVIACYPTGARPLFVWTKQKAILFLLSCSLEKFFLLIV